MSTLASFTIATMSSLEARCKNSSSSYPQLAILSQYASNLDWASQARTSKTSGDYLLRSPAVTTESAPKADQSATVACGCPDV